MASDADLLQRWRAGDGSAGHQLFQRWFATVYRFFINKTCSLEDTEELTRVTFVALQAARDGDLDPGALLPCLLRIAHGVLATYHRGLAPPGAPFDPLRSSILELGAGADTQLECAGAQRLLVIALREIPAELQVALELHYVEALEPDAISAALGISAGAARDRLARARDQLRARVAVLARHTPAGAPDPRRWPDLIHDAFPVHLLSTAGSLEMH